MTTINGDAPNCWSICNGAILEAQRIGKTPQLCNAQSVFLSDYGTCLACLQEYPSPSLSDAVNSPTFQQWIDYCNVTERITTTTVITIDNHLLTIPITTFLGVDTVQETLTSSTPLSSTFKTSTPVPGLSKASSSPLISPTSNQFKGSDSPSWGQTWIDGPVVGSVVGILLIVLPVFL
ncbi:hypothetical protein F4803DRAFT_508982 [Xylaria telfairii]|nr:hypothetical protein F4803DRAFT_508982 [Xylaria telfairii]